MAAAAKAGVDMLVKTTADDSAAWALASRFGRGAVHGAVDMVWQPIANTIDLGQVAVGLFSGGRYEPTWLSGIGQNYQAGMSYGETVTRGASSESPRSSGMSERPLMLAGTFWPMASSTVGSTSTRTDELVIFTGAVVSDGTWMTMGMRKSSSYTL